MSVLRRAAARLEPSCRIGTGLVWIGIVWAIGVAGAHGAESGGAAEPPAVRTLVVILDAVPFATVKEMLGSRADGAALFEGFQEPQPMISTFPSSTSVAMVGLLEPFGLPRSPGYEARFFDWESRKVRGGGAISFFRIDFAWRNFFDWSRKGVVRSAIGGLRPVAVSGARVEKAVDAFFESDKDPYFVYLETTDLAAHMKGPHQLERIFVRLDAAIERARGEHPGVDFRTVIFSDHGVDGDGGRLVNALPAVRSAVRSGGYRPTRRLREPQDVVLTPFGLVSSFEVYTAPELTAPVAEAVVTATGVDLCTYRSDEGLVAIGKSGRARAERRDGPDGPEWRYVAVSGDPLDYLPVAAALADRAPGRQTFPDDWWLEATADHRYPDAIYRISRAFELVENPASILCSLEPGYMYGLKTTESLARITGSRVRWTHGALIREASLGFLLTDDERFLDEGAVRFDRLLVPLTEERPAMTPDQSEGAVADGSEGRRQDKMPRNR